MEELLKLTDKLSDIIDLMNNLENRDKAFDLLQELENKIKALRTRQSEDSELLDKAEELIKKDYQIYFDNVEFVADDGNTDIWDATSLRDLLRKVRGENDR